MRMEIIIGRDPETSRLRLVAGSKGVLDGSIVPASVRPEHCKLIVEGETIRLKNLDINSYTYVNGLPIESKTVTKGDQIALGADRYIFDWRTLDEFIQPEADIRTLKPIWNEYENQNIALQIAERKFNTLRSATGMITMVAIALSIATGGRSLWYLMLYGLAIAISLIFFIKAYQDSSKMPQRRQQLNRHFQHDYVCPHCGHFLGNQSYDILTQNSHCPYCRAKFIH